MGTLVFTMAGVARSGRMDRRMHGLWTGPIGRFLFWLGGLRLERRVSGTPATASPRVLLESLPANQRRRFARFREAFDRVDRELAQLAQRDRELNDALDQVRGVTRTPGGSVGAKQETLISDLEQAQRTAGGRRHELLGALESARLGLLRVKSGVGNADELERELEEALHRS
jgi:hypothetical protein